MLAAIGSVVFDVVSPNIHEIARKSGGDYASKAVMGRRPTLEWVGEADEEWELTGRLFPEALGGLKDMQELHDQRVAGKALPFMRGDGVPLGWVVITVVSEKSSNLGSDGVGRVIEVGISVKRTDPPPNDQVHSTVSGLQNNGGTAMRSSASDGWRDF